MVLLALKKGWLGQIVKTPSATMRVQGRRISLLGKTGILVQWAA